MIIGYAHVSTQDQNPQLQRDALEEAGCEQVFEERVTGTKRERPSCWPACAPCVTAILWWCGSLIGWLARSRTW